MKGQGFNLGLDFSYKRAADALTNLSNPGARGTRGGVVRYRGEDFLGSVTTGTANAVGDILLNGLLTPNIPNTRLSKMAATWQKYAFRKATLRYEPSVAVTQAGQLMLFWDTDPMDALHVNGSAAINVGKAHGGALTQVAQGTKVPLTVDVNGPLFISEYGMEPRLTYQGQFFVLAASSFSAGPLTVGSIWLDYEVEFYTQQVEGLLPPTDAVYTYWRQYLTNNTVMSNTSLAWTDWPTGWTTQTEVLPEWVTSYTDRQLTVVPGIYRVTVNVYTAATPANATSAFASRLFNTTANVAYAGPVIPGQNVATTCQTDNNSWTDILELTSSTGADVTVKLQYQTNNSWTATGGSTYWTMEFMGAIGGLPSVASAVSRKKLELQRESAQFAATHARALVPYRAPDETENDLSPKKLSTREMLSRMTKPVPRMVSNCVEAFSDSDSDIDEVDALRGKVDDLHALILQMKELQAASLSSPSGVAASSKSK